MRMCKQWALSFHAHREPGYEANPVATQCCEDLAQLSFGDWPVILHRKMRRRTWILSFYFCIYCDVDSKQASVLEVSGGLNVATSDQDCNIYKTGKGSQISGEMSSQFHYWEYNLHYPRAFGLSYTVCRGCT